MLVRVVAVVSSLLLCGGPQAWAATDDVAFNNCLESLNDSVEVLKSQIWRIAPLPTVIAEVVKPSLAGDLVIRWESHRNQNGSTSYIVLTRDAVKEFSEDDPDLFEIVLVRHGTAALTEIISANAAVFAKQSNLGILGILACRGGIIAKAPLVWNGHHWVNAAERTK